MARWTDLAKWRGPTDNQGPAMVARRGIVIHIAEGYFEGTLAWQRNRTAQTSSHFTGGRDWGEGAQLVDTDTQAWTQQSGNPHWLSIEMVGFTRGHKLWSPGWEKLTDWQIEFAASILARAHQVYDVPLQIATSPTGKGLGHHSMGAESGVDWGHSDCPGKPIIAQKAAIVARAKQIVSGGNDMDQKTFTALYQGAITDPAVQAQERARVWQYVGGGIPKGMSTLGVLADIHATVRVLGEVIARESASPDEVRALLADIPAPTLDAGEIAREVLAGLDPAAIVAAIPAALASQVVDHLAARIAAPAALG